MNTRRRLMVVLAAWLCCVGSAGAATHRVALAAITSDEYTWESLQAADECAPALQAVLGQTRGIEWIKRPDVSANWEEKALGTFVASLKVARAAKADWMITGRFVAAPAAERELVLEAIDLAHADVLAEQRVAIPGAALKSLPAMAAGVRALLDAAAQRESEVAGRLAIAMVVYPDIPGFQREFEAALSPGCRLL